MLGTLASLLMAGRKQAAVWLRHPTRGWAVAVATLIRIIVASEVILLPTLAMTFSMYWRQATHMEWTYTARELLHFESILRWMCQEWREAFCTQYGGALHS